MNYFNQLYFYILLFPFQMSSAYVLHIHLAYEYWRENARFSRARYKSTTRRVLDHSRFLRW
jgi:hypothetical protein